MSKNNYITKYEREHGLLVPNTETKTTMEIQHISITTLIKVTRKCSCEYCGYTNEDSFYINSKDEKNTNITNSSNVCPQCCAKLKITTNEEIVNSKEIKELNNSNNTANNNAVNQEEINRKKKEHGYKNMFKWGLALTIIFGLSTLSILGSENASSAIGGLIPTIIGIVLIVRSKKMLKQMKPVKEKN